MDTAVADHAACDERFAAKIASKPFVGGKV
jgi:hypothetical protein